MWKGLRNLDRGSAIAGGNQFILLGTSGTLTTVNVDHRHLTGSGETQKRVTQAPNYSFPAFHRGRLIFRNETEIACLKKARSEAREQLFDSAASPTLKP